MTWDGHYALLAAREYGAAGEFDEAGRLLDKARDRVRDPEGRLLLARTEAGIALARGDAAQALAALRGLPDPLPQDLAPDLLALRARAEFRTGQTLQGMRTLDQRSSVLATPAARASNDELLLDQLLLHPPTAAITTAGVSERERGWLELAALLPDAGNAGHPGDPGVMGRVREWILRHPGHPGAAFLPGAAGAMAGAGLAGMPSGAPATIAVLLPLSGKQHAAATAVRDGVAAGWFAAGPAAARPRLAVYDTATLGAAVAYERALTEGAQIVIGPLVREDVAAVVNSRQGALPVPTLALNSLGLLDTVPPPTFLVQFSLDPEQEARAIARRIAEDGLTRGIALFPDSTWGQRVREAFSSELAATGRVTLTSAQYYAPEVQDFTGPLRAALGRFGGAGERRTDPSKPAPARNPEAERAAGPQFAFMAATPQTARAIKPQLRFQMTYEVPIYATSDAWDPSVRTVADMDGLIFPEMPWILYGGQGAPDLWDALQQEWASQGRGRLRLYAFGFDAYSLATQLRGNATFIGVSGLTGTLTVGADGHVQRSLAFARVAAGKPQAAGAGGPTIFVPEPTANPGGASPPR
jgi:outer membrane PBP1 activator LpoA protein